jgi:hypothetical protein
MGLNGELRQTIVRKSEGTALGSTCASLPRLPRPAPIQAVVSICGGAGVRVQPRYNGLKLTDPLLGLTYTSSQLFIGFGRR